MMMSATTTQLKPKGDISSVFSTLGGKKENTLHPSLLQLKKEIAPKDPAVINNAYKRLLESFKQESIEIKEKGSAVIPSITFAEIQANGGEFPPHIVEQIKKRGCIVIRNVVSEEEAMGYKSQVQEYIKKHRDQLVGFPAKDPQVWEIYWTQSQLAARSHPNFNTATLALNKIWHASDDTVVDLTKNLAYCDRLRVRKPQDASFSLQEHIDSGSIERRVITLLISSRQEDFLTSIS
jgi:hypothetical protein